MGAIPKSWKPSRRDGSSTLYCLVGDLVSQEITFVRLIKVFVAITHRGASNSYLPGRREAALTKGASPIPFTYRCPRSGELVQGWAADDLTNGEIYEPVTCTACGRVHLVNAKSGKVLESAKASTAS